MKASVVVLAIVVAVALLGSFVEAGNKKAKKPVKVCVKAKEVFIPSEFELEEQDAWAKDSCRAICTDSRGSALRNPPPGYQWTDDMLSCGTITKFKVYPDDPDYIPGANGYAYKCCGEVAKIPAYRK